MQIMTYKFGSKIEDVEDRLNEFLELVRRYDEANGTDPVPDQVKKACIISNTLEPSPGKGKAKKNPARARRVARNEKKATQAKVTEKRQQNTHDSKVDVETVESMDTKLLIVGTSSRPNLKVKARARESRNPR